MSDGRRKEFLYDPLIPSGTGSSRYTSAFDRPFSAMEALMVCAPCEEPEESVIEQMALREALADALDSLEEEERWIFDMLVVVHLSLRFVGRVVGIPKTTLARKRDQVIAKLQNQLIQNPLISDRFID